MKYSIRRLTGRCLNGSERDRGRLFHAVDGGTWGVALCGKKPGRLSNGFSSDEAPTVTCPKCIKKLTEE